MKTTYANLKELEAARKKAGYKTTIHYAGYFSLTIDGKVRMYYREDENGTRLGNDFRIDFNAYEDDFFEN